MVSLWDPDRFPFQGNGLSPKSQKLWIPDGFLAEGTNRAFLMSATHSGDMYHVRAAVALLQLPLILYDCTAINPETMPRPATKDLEDYLDLNTRKLEPYMERFKGRVFRTSWSYATLSQQKKRPDSMNAMINGRHVVPPCDLQQKELSIFSESDATTIISRALSACHESSDETVEEQFLRYLLYAVTIVNDRETVQSRLDGLATNLFPAITKPKAALVLHRDSGSAKAGAHPELDSMAAIYQVARALDGLGVQPVLCGTPDGFDCKGFATIGAYYSQLAALALPAHEKRDVEALFLWRLYRTRKIDMVVGFRSGGLDVCTFVGIPTTSISLRKYVGEGRHQKLCYKSLRRLNVSYEQPRHNTTEWLMTKRGRDKKLFASPYWTYALDHYGPPPLNELELRHFKLTDVEWKAECKDPKKGVLYPSDYKILVHGLTMAIFKYVNRDVLVSPLNVCSRLDAFTATYCYVDRYTLRSVYPASLQQEDEIVNYFRDMEDVEAQDIKVRITRGVDLGEDRYYGEDDLSDARRDYKAARADVRDIFDGRSRSKKPKN